MTEVKNPTKQGDISSGKNTAEIIFGGKKYIINRLKAGKFYKALKVYMDMVKEVTPEEAQPIKPGAKPGDKSKDKVKEAPVNIKKVMDSMFQSWPKKMVEFLSICCSTIKDLKEPLTIEKINEIAYPEEITQAFTVCLKLNKITENLKNFAAPMGELGVGIK